MITRQQLDQLLQFKNGQYLIASCYLNLDRRQPLKIRLKDLLQEAERDSAGKVSSRESRESLREDFRRIESFATSRAAGDRRKSVAIFSCAGEKFWQTYELPRRVRDILVANHEAYLRPLAGILAEYHRYCVVLADRVRGQLFEVYMGEILEHSAQKNPVPRRVREGGFQGREERHIERRHDQAVHQHYARLADAAFALFKRDRFDWLILGGHPETLAEFKPHLHSYLRERWVGDFSAEPGKITVADVLARSLEIERRAETEREHQLAANIVQTAEARGLAVTGLPDTLAALTSGEIQTLAVEDGFETPGFHCRHCRFISLDARICPHCARATEQSPDIVDEAVEIATHNGCAVYYLHGPTPLADRHIGALLRYRT
jgi:peptide subunit release factor 1 (eRF1)